MTTISDERLAELLAEVDIEQEYAVANAEADQNPMLAVVAVGEFALSDMASILTELQSLRAQGGVRVKPLEWTRGWMNAEAQTEIGQYIITYRRDGSFEWGIGILKGWASSWDEAKSAAQADYERRILSAIEASPAPVSEEGAVQPVAKTGLDYTGFYRKCSADTPGAEWGEGIGYYVHDEQARIEGQSRVAALYAAKGGQ